MELPPWALVLLVAVALWGGVRLARLWRRWAARRRTRVGLRGEKVALKLLRRRGFDVVATQAPAKTTVWVDGKPRRFEVRADAIVHKGRTRYVAEFKTGAAASISNRSTRRQLLEYARTYDVDALLLVDATTRKITEIEFEAG